MSPAHHTSNFSFLFWHIHLPLLCFGVCITSALKKYMQHFLHYLLLLAQVQRAEVLF